MEKRVHTRRWAMQLGMVVLAAGGLMLDAPVQGANIIWTGDANDGLFETGGNWASGNPPANNDWQDTAVFNSTATAGTVTLSSNRSIGHIDFQASGWTLTGSKFTNLGTVKSGGAGTNTFGSNFELHNNRTWTIDAGNTLYMSGPGAQVYLRGNNLTVTGGGTLQIANGIAGFGSGAWGIRIGDAVVQMDTASLFAGGASADARFTLTDDNAVFRVKATETQVNSWIGGRIRNETAHNLVITDIGDGYMQVSVPEPASIGLLGISGAALLRRRRPRPEQPL